jgi:hypothetical protein
MLPTGAFAVAIGTMCFVLIAFVSMRGAHRKRRARDGGAVIPLGEHYDDGGDGGGK